MGSTNFTPNYSLPQFIGTDKPAWLTDVNGAFSNIDTAIKNAADAASNASSVAGSASNTATAAANTANTLDTQINTPSTGLAAVVSDHTTDISDIDSKIGTTPLTTVAQTLTGAIEEVKGSIPTITGLLQLVAASEVSAEYDGSKTVVTACNEAYTALATVFSGLAADEYIRITSITYNNSVTEGVTPFDSGLKQAIPASIEGLVCVMGSNNLTLTKLVISSGSSVWRAASSMTPTDIGSQAPAAGIFAKIGYEKYKIYA